jgi:hypothetical protein
MSLHFRLSRLVGEGGWVGTRDGALGGEEKVERMGEGRGWGGGGSWSGDEN